jgi:hypothetical protein
MSKLTISQSILFSPLSLSLSREAAQESNRAISLGITFSQVPPRKVWQEVKPGYRYFSSYYLLSGRPPPPHVWKKVEPGHFSIYYLL